MERESKDKHRYDDLLELPHHVSKVHPQMPVRERAAQFSPFAALTGYEAAVRETARLTDELAELDEDCREELDRRLALLWENLGRKPEVTILYFEPDGRKAGGEYRSAEGTVKKIDTWGRCLVMSDGLRLPMEHIVQIEGELFEKTEEEAR